MVPYRTLSRFQILVLQSRPITNLPGSVILNHPTMDLYGLLPRMDKLTFSIRVQYCIANVRFPYDKEPFTSHVSHIGAEDGLASQDTNQYTLKTPFHSTCVTSLSDISSVRYVCASRLCSGHHFLWHSTFPCPHSNQCLLFSFSSLLGVKFSLDSRWIYML